MSWNSLRIVTPPSGAIISLADAKAHLRVTSDDDDDFISGLIAAATAFIEGPAGIGVALLTQTWRFSLDGFPPCGVIRVPLCPVQAVTGVTWIDYGGTTHTLDPSQYNVDLDRDPAVICRGFGIAWPSTVLPSSGVVKVTFRCGYGDTPAAIPADLIHAAKLLLGDWAENREASVGLERSSTPTELPLGVSSILAKYRVTGF